MASIPFNDARGSASLLQMAPPFAFSDVTMSVFPLRASLPTLQSFCRNYLNQASDHVQFRPFIPYVYLVILDYGRMSVEAANMGWISQREVAFGVPLRWLNVTSNGLEFHDWAFTSPFIFVDNELSMSTGREVFGWPKLLARLDPSVSEWVRDPHGSRRVFQVSTQGAAEAYAGETSEYRSLLSVHQHRTAGMFDIPTNLDAITKPMSQMSGVAASVSRLGMELTKTFLGMASDGITGSSVLPDFTDLETFREQLEPDRMKAWLNAKEWSSGLKNSLWSMFPRLYANTINFKQFRDTANPHNTCYQAVTAAKMPVTSVKQGGFLGPQNMLFGQLDGGFHIEIHDLAGLPIVDSLGLEVAGVRESNGTTVSTLMPVAPLWMKVDMTYGLGETVIWRGRRSKWNKGQILEDAVKAAERRHLTEEQRAALETVDEVVDGAEDIMLKGVEDSAQLEPLADLDDLQSFDYLRTMNFFNTARGASEAVGGSFSMPDASVRVLPLKADPKALQKFTREYLHIEDEMRFEAWGDFVYLVISDFKQVNSQQSAMTKRRAREMSMLVPVKCYEWYDNGRYADVVSAWEADPEARDLHGREKLLTTGFVNVFTYVDDVETAITANEVFGVPSLGSEIASTENDWLSRNRGTQDIDESILRMRAKVLPELMAGAKAVDRTLIEVNGARHYGKLGAIETRQKSVNRWIRLLAADLEKKAGEAGAEYQKSSVAGKSDEQKRTEWIQHSSTAMGEGFALALLSGEMPFNQFALKQFRDSKDTKNACYQGLVQRRHKIRKVTDVSELSGPLHVTITDFPTQPITKILGLIPKFSYPGKDRVAHVFEPIRPFSFNGDLVRGAGMTLFERIGSEKWQAVDLPEQIFGWRKLTDFEAHRMWYEDDPETHSDILVGRDPGPNMADRCNKVVRKRSTKAVQDWFRQRQAAGATSDVFFKNREQPKSVGAVTFDEHLDGYDPSSGQEISNWYRHAIETEGYMYSQSEAAMRIERFSPATVIDKVLARQWGKTKNSNFYDMPYADFCIPVHTVSKQDAELLFPTAERQNDYWPQSEAFFEAEEKKWRDETSAFVFELQASLRSLALAFPRSLAESNSEVRSIREPKEIFARIRDELNLLLDPSHKQIAEALVTKFTASIEGVDDDVGMTRTNEELTFAFFERHLPSKVKLRRTSFFEELAVVGQTQSRIHFSASEWREIAEGLDQIRSKMSEAFKQLPDGQLSIWELADRARANADRVHRFDGSRSPAEVLTQRLERKTIAASTNR